MASTPRNLIVFPNYVGTISGVNALELGATYAWVHTTAGRRTRVLRSKFTPQELADTGHALAFKARQVADAASA